MTNAQFDNFEDDFQKQYDDVEMQFQPGLLLTIKLLKFDGISVSYFSDMVDTPDPQFRVICPKLTDPKTRKLATSSIKSDTTSGEINQTFKFVLPETLQPGEECPVEIELYDLDVISDDLIGKVCFDAMEIPSDGRIIPKTFKFGYRGKGGKLEAEISKTWRTSPDFRYSLALHPKEIEFRKKRIPIVCEAMKNVLGHEKAPRNHLETPIVSLVGSGGGYRSVNGMCGVTEALEDAGLMDIFTYACGLSGSSWYLTSAYANKGMLPHERKDFHNGLRERMESNALVDMINPVTIYEFNKRIGDKREKHGQPRTFADYFPGYLCGKQLLGEECDATLSKLEPYVREAKMPLPLLVALHVKNNASANKFHTYVERSPFEISVPSFGIGVKPEDEGSLWHRGFVVKTCPEPLLFFNIGMLGCAFSIIFNKMSQGEVGDSYLQYVEEERIDGRRKAILTPGANEGFESDDSDDSDDDSDDATSITTSPEQNENRENLATSSSTSESGIGKILSYLFPTRDTFLGRTAKLFNFALGLKHLRRFRLNPIGEINPHHDEEKELISKLGAAEHGLTKCMSTKKKIIRVVDAGIYKNLPTDAVLRPQRTADLLICIDFTDFGSDSNFSYKTILVSAAHAWQNGLKFPNVDFEKITNCPPKELLIFPSDDDDCPTVLYFTMCNAKFRKLKNYVPLSAEKCPDGDGRKFNDFPVFDEGNNYSTFRFQYDKYNFDQLRELMYFNVSSHIEEIKSALVDAIARKRRRLAKMV